MADALEVVYALSKSFLGGSRYWSTSLRHPYDVHAAIVRGVPYGSLIHFLRKMKELSEDDVAKVLGVSTRTLRRHTATPANQMPADLASRTWLLAETLAKAAEVFGSRESAERWMSRPAVGLDGRKPIDLLQTIQGAELVSDFLGRLEYNVYS